MPLFVKATFLVKRRFSERLKRDKGEEVIALPRFKTGFLAWVEITAS